MKRGRAALRIVLPVVALALAIAVIQLATSAPEETSAPPRPADLLPPPTLPIRVAPQDPAARSDSAPGTFEGHVLSAETGAPIPRADLTFSRGGAADSVQAGEDGSFLFRPPTQGRWLLAAVAAQGFFPFAPEWGFSPVQLEAAPGRHVRGIDVFLTPAAEVVGLVVDEDGRPIAGADVALLGAGVRAALIPIPGRFVTDATGAFRAAAPRGSILEARKAGYHPGHAQVDVWAMVNHRVRIILAAGSAGADPEGATLKGTVVSLDGRVVPGALVEAAKTHGWAYSGTPVAQTVADADGRFRFTGLDRSPHQLTARADGFVPGLVARVLPGGAPVQITLPHGGRLHGCVRDERTGAPVAPFAVKVYFSRGNFDSGPNLNVSVANPSGCYVLEEMVPGPNTVIIQAPHRAPSLPFPIDIPVPPLVAELDVALSPGGTLTGVVRDEASGAPLAGAWLQIRSIPPADYAAPVDIVGEAVTDLHGSFTATGLPARVRVTADAAGHHLTSSGEVAVPAGGVAGPIEIALRPQREGDAGPVEPVGIGAVLVPSGKGLVVEALRPGTAGASSELRPGDQVLEIDGSAVADLGLGGAVAALRGAEGTSVFLQVRRGNRTLDIEVPRTKRR